MAREAILVYFFIAVWNGPFVSGECWWTQCQSANLGAFCPAATTTNEQKTDGCLPNFVNVQCCRTGFNGQILSHDVVNEEDGSRHSIPVNQDNFDPNNHSEFTGVHDHSDQDHPDQDHQDTKQSFLPDHSDGSDEVRGQGHQDQHGHDQNSNEPLRAPFGSLKSSLQGPSASEHGFVRVMTPQTHKGQSSQSDPTQNPVGGSGGHRDGFNRLDPHRHQTEQQVGQNPESGHLGHFGSDGVTSQNLVPSHSNQRLNLQQPFSLLNDADGPTEGQRQGAVDPQDVHKNWAMSYQGGSPMTSYASTERPGQYSAVQRQQYMYNNQVVPQSTEKPVQYSAHQKEQYMYNNQVVPQSTEKPGQYSAMQREQYMYNNQVGIQPTELRTKMETSQVKKIPTWQTIYGAGIRQQQQVVSPLNSMSRYYVNQQEYKSSGSDEVENYVEVPQTQQQRVLSVRQQYQASRMN